MIRKALFFLAIAVITAACDKTPPPDTIGALPTERQMAWHEMQFYAFVHFNMNTFTDMEWGMGGESPALFNPSELDCRQWARICKDAGMKGIILTAKHHDGFCLWPSAFTEHSVKNSPWKNGQGDVVRELADACKEYGLKFGIYLSPWDRNHADYGTDKYLTYYRNQLHELMTNYGEVFEVWFDGANGGSGYYGGANEKRNVDRKTYYDWPNTRQIVRDLQPNAVMFSDAGPDVRWVGNEKGWAGETNWCLLRANEFYPGSPNSRELPSGHPDGTHWVPAEVDVSIRPGWFYHAAEDSRVKTVKELVDIYYNSIGRNASFLLNLPVDRRGLVHEKDAEQLLKMSAVIRADFETNLVKNVHTQATNVRGRSVKFNSKKAVDNDYHTYWSTDDHMISGSLIIDFGKETTFNRFLVQEYIPLGQRVERFSVEAHKDGKWQAITGQTTIGYKRILRFDDVTTTKVRLNILQSKVCFAIANIEIYRAPKLLEPPVISRDKDGIVTIEGFDTGLKILYSTDGNEPTMTYEAPFEMKGKGHVKAVATDPVTGKSSEVTIQKFDITQSLWRVILPDGDDYEPANFMIDSNGLSFWLNNGEYPIPVVIDLGEQISLSGITYLPKQSGVLDGTVSHYKMEVSTDNKAWTEVATGEFSNIKNNPVLQEVTFPSIPGRYIRFTGLKEIDDRSFISIAEIGVITK